jgi:tetratricopeptide (TPR) repeat protein
MTRHLMAVDLLAFMERDDTTVDLRLAESHLASCSLCSARLADLRSFETLLADTIQLTSIDTLPPIEQVPEFLTLLTNESRRQERARDVAEGTFGLLRGQPLETWRATLAAAPHRHTGELIERIVEEAIIELDRRATHTLALLDEAMRVVASLEPRLRPHHEAEIWKNRANALRMLGRYEDALVAAGHGFTVAEHASGGAFTLAQLIYTRGGILFKMGRLIEALADARDAGIRFSEFGDIRRVIHARTLEAAVQVEQGEVAEALRIYKLLLPQLERLGDAPTAARVTANIGVAYGRLGNTSEARRCVIAARGQYAVLGLDVEVIRADWALAGILLLEGRTTEGLSLHRDAAMAFEERGMLADAGFVRLDMAEALLTRGALADAASLARSATEVFSRNGAHLAFMRALAYLRESTERQLATPTLVQYVRKFLITDDHAAEFHPPPRP